MENQLYIRIRGKILGPYNQEKLQSLSRRGQLSRLHEVSQDAANWVRASTYPELFLVEALPGAVLRSLSEKCVWLHFPRELQFHRDGDGGIARMVVKLVRWTKPPCNNW